jgi:hypothetical protein
VVNPFKLLKSLGSNAKIIGYGARRVRGAVNDAEEFLIGQQKYLAQEFSKGLGKLAGKEFKISQKGLNIVEQHLAKFGATPENSAMVARLRQALNEGRPITGADASFYLHEVAEATSMKQTMNKAVSFEDAYDTAHDAVLKKYGVSNFSVYHPEVIKALPDVFNPLWGEFWKRLGH